MNNEKKELIIIIMSFFNEVEKLFNGEDLGQDYEVHLLGMRCAVVEGYKKIKSFSTSEVILELKNKSRLILRGAKMIIKKLETSEIVIEGEVLCVEVEKGV